MSQIDEYLKQVVVRNGSDLHFIAGEPPRARIYGELQILAPETLQAGRVESALLEIMSAKSREEFQRHDSADFAYSLENLARFRVNVFRHVAGLGAVLRAIPSKAKTLEELQMPAVVAQLCKQPQGMLLVTGKTGSGKSTTLAAMIDEINRQINGHILTIEDPIEFVHQRKRCLISQREVGVHSPSFAAALHSALREDPDVILVGEMRDLETVSIAVTAAEMGILVMGTLHTNGAAQTVDRIVNAFPTDKQSHVRTMLSTSLSVEMRPSVRTQRLCASSCLITPSLASSSRLRLICSRRSGNVRRCLIHSGSPSKSASAVISRITGWYHSPKYSACTGSSSAGAERVL